MPKSSVPEGGRNPFEDLIPEIGDLPVAPVLEPINDEWSMSNLWNPVDEKDCAAYPASPYCDNELFAPSFIGFEPEIKTNGCETCLYVYPVIAFLKVQPTIICKRDPNCGKKYQRNIPPQQPPEIPEIPTGYKLVAQVARSFMYSADSYEKSAGLAKGYKAYDDGTSEFYFRTQEENNYLTVGYGVKYGSLVPKNVPENEIPTPVGGMEYLVATVGIGGEPRESTVQGAKSYFGYLFQITTGSDNRAGDIFDPFGRSPFPYNLYFSPVIDFFKIAEARREFWADHSWGVEFRLEALDGRGSFKVEPPSIKPPPPPPPYRDDGTNNRRGTEKQDNKRPVKRPIRKKDDDMCCNDCRDAADRTNTVLREVREIKKSLGSGQLEKALNAAVGIGDGSVTGILNLLAKRIGTSRYPIEVPQSLLSGVGDNVLQVQSMTDYLYWLTNQVDALVGEFPIKIEVDDIDPLTPGKQPKTLVIDNIAEAIAETYALSLKSAINQEVELNVLFRLAGEVIATKNSSAITQDYVKANATFLGYKGNQVSRELTYNFDLELEQGGIPSADTLELMLKNKKAFIQGWEINDKETVVGFLQKLMFAAGIIKAVFFRGKKRLKTFNDELTRMATDAKEGAANWDKFVRDIEDPNSDFNKDAAEKPEIKEIRKTPPSPKG